MEIFKVILFFTKKNYIVIVFVLLLCSIWHFTVNNNISKFPGFKVFKNLTFQCPSNKTDIKNCKINITMNSPGSKCYVFIESLNSCNISKHYGGDFWWMKIIGPTSFNVPLIDGNNGFYYQEFFLKLEGVYVVSLMLEFSNYDGLKDPPKDWFKKGDYQGRRQNEDYFGRNYDYILETKKFEFVVSKGTVPSNDEQLQGWHFQPFCVINNAHGSWINDKYVTVNAKTDSNPKHELLLRSLAQKSKKNTVLKKTMWMYGDSLTRQFFIDMKSTEICSEFNCQLTNTWTYPLTNENPAQQPFDDKDFNQSKFLDHIKEVIMNPLMMSNNSVLVINFGLHILKNINMSQAEKLLNGFIDMVYEIKINNVLSFPKIVWKTTTPAYIEIFLKSQGMNNLERHLIKQAGPAQGLYESCICSALQ
ncbi:uncharacterized protein LOC136091195 [Hydra vulgaris]|uniref:Uncharacterized protein LOC136091195 n=1 Tax=Hydra vulgaris TaxID=6087 RepID=A0ABM4DIG6_HYDVU